MHVNCDNQVLFHMYWRLQDEKSGHPSRTASARLFTFQWRPLLTQAQPLKQPHQLGRVSFNEIKCSASNLQKDCVAAVQPLSR